MSFYVNGVEITAVTLNGVTIDKLNFNGVEVFSAGTPAIWTAGSSVTKTSATGTATAQITLATSGTITLDSGTNGTWLPSGKTAANYRVKWSRTSGNTPSSNVAQNTWKTLDSQFYISLIAGLDQYLGCVVSITIEETATGAQLVQSVSMTSSGGSGTILL